MPDTHIGFLFFQSWAFKQSSHGLSRAVLVSVLPQSLPRGHTKTQKSPLPCSYFILPSPFLAFSRDSLKSLVQTGSVFTHAIAIFLSLLSQLLMIKWFILILEDLKLKTIIFKADRK